MAALRFRGMTIKIKGLINNNGLPYYQRAVPKKLQKRIGKTVIKIPLASKRGSVATLCQGLWDAHTALFDAMKGDKALVPSTMKRAALELLAVNGLKQGEGSKSLDEFPFPASGPEGWKMSDLFDEVLMDMFDGEPNELTKTTLKALDSPLPLLLSEAFDVYLSDNVKRNDATFVDKQRAYWNNLIRCVGDIAFVGLTIEHARKYRDQRLEQGLESTSVQREIATIKAIINAVNRDQQLNNRNPFEKLPVQSTKDPDDDGKTPYSRTEIQLLIKQAKEYDDEKRRIVLVLAVTGARLAEIVGLRRKDVDIDAQVLHIQPHSSRRLKNKNSKRSIPMLPVATEALKAQLEAHSGDYVFPTYCDDQECKNNGASVTLNSWARKFVKDSEKSMHCLRHSQRDNLRAVQCPDAVAKELGGWSTNSDVSVGYGNGYPIDVKREWLSKAYQWIEFTQK